MGPLWGEADIKDVALEPGQHQMCNPLDSFDLRCESVTWYYVTLLHLRSKESRGLHI